MQKRIKHSKFCLTNLVSFFYRRLHCWPMPGWRPTSPTCYRRLRGAIRLARPTIPGPNRRTSPALPSLAGPWSSKDHSGRTRRCHDWLLRCSRAMNWKCPICGSSAGCTRSNVFTLHWPSWWTRKMSTSHSRRSVRVSLSSCFRGQAISAWNTASHMKTRKFWFFDKECKQPREMFRISNLFLFRNYGIHLLILFLLLTFLSNRLQKSLPTPV